MPDAINASFFLMTRLPYLKPFYDVNKRTSRIACNIPLIESRLSPMSFVDFDKKEYLEGLISFYELGDERLVKHAYLKAYIASAFRYLPLSEDARWALSMEREKNINEIYNYVLEGERDEHPVWLQHTDRE